jgi:putative RNA 2'-phosphotransferase
MNEKQLVRVSKFLSKHLRHTPEEIGLELEVGGWVTVEKLLEGCRKANFLITRAELDQVVADNSKQRFAFDETGTKIRANQGHSVDVDLQLMPTPPPAVLYHGTATRFLADILRDGLRKMARHHVHLSVDVPTATNVGQRHGKPTILLVDATAMAQAGYLFYVSANGVWLTDEIPPQFLRPLEGPST